MTAHALMIDPDAPPAPELDEWYFDACPNLYAEDGTEVGQAGICRLWCRYKDGKIVIADIESERWLHGKTHWTGISNHPDPDVQALCRMIRRGYSQRDLEDRYVDAVEGRQP
jgi:hypothetical protein